MGGSGSPTPVPPDRGPCPEVVAATVTGPAPGIVPNSWLDVALDGPSVVFVDPVSDAKVGSLAGVSGLATLIRCLRQGVVYRAYVDAVSGGRVEVTVTREG